MGPLEMNLALQRFGVVLGAPNVDVRGWANRGVGHARRLPPLRPAVRSDRPGVLEPALRSGMRTVGVDGSNRSAQGSASALDFYAVGNSQQPQLFVRVGWLPISNERSS